MKEQIVIKTIAVSMTLSSALLFSLPGTSIAAIGKTYLTAYDLAKGSQASAGRYGRQIQLAPPRSTKAKTGTAGSSSRSKTTNQSITLCGKTYVTTKRGVAWVAAHRKAGHELVVRKHVGKRKYSVLCGKIPKRTKSKQAKAKPAKTKQ